MNKEQQAVNCCDLLADWVVRAALVAMLLAPALAQAQALDAWEPVGPARIGASFDEVSRDAPLACSEEGSRRFCTLSAQATIVFAGVPVTRIEALFEGSRLERVKVVLGVRQYQDLLRVLTAHYGEGEDRSFLAIAGMGVDFMAGVYVWHTATSSLVLEQYAGKIDRSALTYGSAPAMADLVGKSNAYPRGARRDL